MLGFLVDLFSGFVGLLTGVLPRSPFSDLTLGDDVHNMLGWLNWLVPIQGMLGLMGAVVALLVVVVVANFLVSNGSRFASIATGGD